VDKLPRDKLMAKIEANLMPMTGGPRPKKPDGNSEPLDLFIPASFNLSKTIPDPSQYTISPRLLDAIAARIVYNPPAGTKKKKKKPIDRSILYV